MQKKLYDTRYLYTSIFKNLVKMVSQNKSSARIESYTSHA